MMIKRLFDKRKKSVSRTAEQKMDEIKFHKKWIYASLVVYFSDELSEKEISEIGGDITSIVNNTHSIFNSKHKFIGCINPYLGIDTVFGYEETTKDMVMHSLTREFHPLGQGTERGYQIIILPLQDPNRTYTNIHGCNNLPYKIWHDVNLYSTENLGFDYWILAGASDFICKKYDIKITEERPSFNPLIENNVPIIELHDHLLIIRYSIQDRIESAKENPKLDKFVLGQNVQDVLDLIDFISKKQPDSNWVKAVEKIISDSDINSKINDT